MLFCTRGLWRRHVEWLSTSLCFSFFRVIDKQVLGHRSSTCWLSWVQGLSTRSTCSSRETRGPATWKEQAKRYFRKASGCTSRFGSSCCRVLLMGLLLKMVIHRQRSQQWQSQPNPWGVLRCSIHQSCCQGRFLPWTSQLQPSCSLCLGNSWGSLV